MIHVSLHVEGAIKSGDFKGRDLDILKIARYEGKRVIPMSKCSRFDHQKGCAGHPTAILPHDEEMIRIEYEYYNYITQKNAAAHGL